MTRVRETVEVLRAGGVVLLPTDTVYGLAVMPGDDAAVDRLFALKARPRGMHLPVMVSDPLELPGLGLVLDETAWKLARSRFVPGPLTLVLGFGEGLPRASWLAGREEVAARVPDDEFLLAVLREAGPLLVTSANRHGMPAPTRVAGMVASLTGKPDLVIERGTGREVPSTIVNCRRVPPVIERHGVVRKEDIDKIIGS